MTMLTDFQKRFAKITPYGYYPPLRTVYTSTQNMRLVAAYNSIVPHYQNSGMKKVTWAYEIPSDIWLQLTAVDNEVARETEQKFAAFRESARKMSEAAQREREQLRAAKEEQESLENAERETARATAASKRRRLIGCYISLVCGVLLAVAGIIVVATSVTSSGVSE